MTYYDVHFEVIIRVESKDGIDLAAGGRMSDIGKSIGDLIREKHPNSGVFPSHFQIVNNGGK